MKAIKTVTVQMNMSSGGELLGQNYREATGLSGFFFTFGRPKLGALLTAGRNAITWPGVETVSQAYADGKDTPNVGNPMQNVIPIASFVTLSPQTIPFYNNSIKNKIVQVPFSVSALKTDFVWSDSVSGAGVAADLAQSVRQSLGIDLNASTFLQAVGDGNYDALFSNEFSSTDFNRQGRGFNMPETPGACSFAVGFDVRDMPYPIGTLGFNLAITFASLS